MKLFLSSFFFPQNKATLNLNRPLVAALRLPGVSLFVVPVERRHVAFEVLLQLVKGAHSLIERSTAEIDKYMSKRVESFRVIELFRWNSGH